MAHQRERLPFGLEPRQDAPRVHSWLDELQGDVLPHRRDLHGEKDDAEASIAERLEDAVGAEVNGREIAGVGDFVERSLTGDLELPPRVEAEHGFEATAK